MSKSKAHAQADWLPGFRAALQQVLLDNGTLVESRSVYGRIHWIPGQLHIKRYRNSKQQDPEVPDWCGGWAAVADLHEEQWSQFQDTFSENSNTEILVAKVTCRCGFVTGERLEYEASLSALITGVLRAAAGVDDETVDVGRRYGCEDYSRKEDS